MKKATKIFKSVIYYYYKTKTVMRFTKEKELMDAYFNNTFKLKTKFLWFPLTIDGETRWLETATIEYKVCRELNILSLVVYYWKPWNFINK